MGTMGHSSSSLAGTNMLCAVLPTIWGHSINKHPPNATSSSSAGRGVVTMATGMRSPYQQQLYPPLTWQRQEPLQ